MEHYLTLANTSGTLHNNEYEWNTTQRQPAQMEHYVTTANMSGTLPNTGQHEWNTM